MALGIAEWNRRVGVAFEGGDGEQILAGSHSFDGEVSFAIRVRDRAVLRPDMQSLHLYGAGQGGRQSLERSGDRDSSTQDDLGALVPHQDHTGVRNAQSLCNNTQVPLAMGKIREFE